LVISCSCVNVSWIRFQLNDNHAVKYTRYTYTESPLWCRVRRCNKMGRYVSGVSCVVRQLCGNGSGVPKLDVTDIYALSRVHVTTSWLLFAEFS